jgi:hypothetical protein
MSLSAGEAAILREVQKIHALLEFALLRPPVPARGLRDDDDVRVLLAVAAAAIGTRFTSSEVMRHARLDKQLADALEAADCDSPRALGQLFRRVEGKIIEGVRLECVGTDREGLLWRVVQVSQVVATTRNT